MDGGTQAQTYCSQFPIGTVNNGQDLANSAEVAIRAYAATQGYSPTLPIIWQSPTVTQTQNWIAAATSSLATVARTGSYTDLTNKPTIPTFGTTTYANPTRSLNTAFQISTSSAELVSYTVDVGTSLSLSGGTTGTVVLEYADNAGMTTNVKTVQSTVNAQTGTLTIGLGLNQTTTASLSGVIPAGKYVELLTANTVGTPTFTFRAAQEVGLPF